GRGGQGLAAEETPQNEGDGQGTGYSEENLIQPGGGLGGARGFMRAFGLAKLRQQLLVRIRVGLGGNSIDG
ncbi:hypothetical protein, partial [Leifsonia sp. SIMBA_070]|uniref:hypothetical protein n=1 Tax=Leifsonia sp. SIMBA_070 TaxID=3085810 RepID=UPI00397E0FA8